MATNDADNAAARIQARFRGARTRTQHQRAVTGITKLQALQRGRYSRRAFAQLLEFSREQEGFAVAAKRRQLRIARNEQELYFLQHTTVETLERIRQFQHLRAARMIQHTWRLYAAIDASAKSAAGLKHPRDPILSFNPFGLAHADLRVDSDNDIHVASAAPLPRQPNNSGVLPLTASSMPAHSTANDSDSFAQRRKEVYDRIKQRVQTQKQQSARNNKNLQQQQQLTAPRTPPPQQPNRRRELYDQARHLQATAAQRVCELEKTHRATRSARECERATLVASCAARLTELQQDVATRLEPLDASYNNSTQHTADAFEDACAAQTARFDAETQDWDDARKTQAWRFHSRLVQDAMRPHAWWQTSIAGTERDMRRVYAQSPWEHERQVWTWPLDAAAAAALVPKEASRSQAPASDMDVFLFSLNAENTSASELMQRPAPMDDDVASEWWRVYCKQPHWQRRHETSTSDSVSDQHTATNATHLDDDASMRWTPEALANPVFYRLCRDSERRARVRDCDAAVRATVERFEKLVAQRVDEVETQIDENTTMLQDLALRRQQITKRRTREDRAVVDIQRVVRGARGRKRAQQTRAEFFVMVRGRAIRKGKCEECGEQRAVLECRECEESVHFCPVCWVYVHATRRRKHHVAIPMNNATEMPVVKGSVTEQQVVARRGASPDAVEPATTGSTLQGTSARAGGRGAKTASAARGASERSHNAEQTPTKTTGTNAPAPAAEAAGAAVGTRIAALAEVIATEPIGAEHVRDTNIRMIEQRIGAHSEHAVPEMVSTPTIRVDTTPVVGVETKQGD